MKSEFKNLTHQIKFIVILFTLLSCSKNEKKNKFSNEVTKQEIAIVKKETVSDSLGLKIKENITHKTRHKNKCNCNWNVENLPTYTNLTFSNNGEKFNIDTLLKWKNNPKRLEIKSILLIDFDTIPLEMGIFKNVERVSIRGINSENIIGLEIFEKLKILETNMLWNFDLSNADKWLKGIEIIHSNKTKFIGLKSFKKLPNLKELKISFSGFEPFPEDFTSLKCLNYFQTGAHTFGNIDLNKINLINLPCLKYVEFHSWRKNIKGIPKGIENIEQVKIYHGNLTEKEKEILKKTNG